MKKKEHINNFERDFSRRLIIECCQCDHEQDFTYVIGDEIKRSAETIYEYGWRYGTPKDFDVIGPVCPECVKEFGLETLKEGNK